MKNLEKQLKALANRRRLTILKYLKKVRQAPVGEIAGEIKLSVKATSKHLNILAVADILEREQKSLSVYYSLSSDPSPSAKQVISIL